MTSKYKDDLFSFSAMEAIVARATEEIQEENDALWDFVESVDEYMAATLQPMVAMLERRLALDAFCQDDEQGGADPDEGGIPEDIVGYLAATSDGPDVAEKRYG